MAHVTFIHGIFNKPECEVLLNQWRQALAADNGIDLAANGITSSLVYWADVLYETPKSSSTRGIQESLSEVRGIQESLSEASEFVDEDTTWENSLEGSEKEFVDLLSAKLASDLESVENSASNSLEGVAGSDLERGLLPTFLTRPIMKRFLRDVHHYLFNVEHSPREGEVFRVQDEIRSRFVKKLEEAAANNQGGKHIVISHSMGTVIAYDCLKRVPNCPTVNNLFTVGSPLGLSEIQDQLKPEWQRRNGFPSIKVSEKWANAFNRLDPVSFLDSSLANDYQKDGQRVVMDIPVPNSSSSHHDFAQYVRSQELRDKLRSMLEL